MLPTTPGHWFGPLPYSFSTELIAKAEAGDLDAVKKLVRWAYRAEGCLHRIEEWPEHEPNYPEDQRLGIKAIAQMGLGLHDD